MTSLTRRPTTRSVSRSRTVFECTSCGTPHPAWVGRCGTCGEWNVLEEVPVVGPEASIRTAFDEVVHLRSLTDIESTNWVAEPTGLTEADRALGGGLVPGSVTLISGEPGIGKSTLTLQLAAERVRSGGRVLLVSAEESAAQVRLRAERLKAVYKDLWLVDSGSVDAVIDRVEDLKPDLVVVDSIQTVQVNDERGLPGSIGQVRAAAQRLVTEAKARSLATVLVGHLTKEGSLAGPKALEHLVDTVVELTGDRHQALRVLRVVKHRFGPTDEIGLFEMAEDGLRSVDDPSRLFLADRAADVAGSVVLPTLEGHRPLLVEIQALVVRATMPHPRRSPQGLDGRRLALLLAVLDRRVGISLGALDVYATVVGGASATEPAADLPLALAVVSGVTGRPVGGGVSNPRVDDTVALGEVGLGGELRQVVGTERRLREAVRLGYSRAVVPAGTVTAVEGVELIRVGNLAEAAAAVGLLSAN
ncbi:MAG TPA: DNA repair protein RadA [Acidimicrobiaceae bacterium]|nr:DNA repair protein RadA [Acidimicrobiaceae bacterium]